MLLYLDISMLDLTKLYIIRLQMFSQDLVLLILIFLCYIYQNVHFKITNVLARPCVTLLILLLNLTECTHQDYQCFSKILVTSNPKKDHSILM